ncbi:hydrolase [Amphritea japonica]|uniref:Glutamate carboxypeptidase n=1 Tax=Amphritea japonica ATCC BAA-1530 TaxID=1278309 RepID=A0A7R6SR46_9GAMM|nr:hydrolase [Amphritea japonica]BBB24760.1 glutamate carboxypeptidase [Amphritea japonica ATCC BAA-1530]
MSSLLRKITERQPALTESLIELAGINSGTLNKAGVDDTGRLLGKTFQQRLGCTHEQVQLPPYLLYQTDGNELEHPLGDLHLFRKRPEAPLQILLSGHLDTVFPPDSDFQQCDWLDPQTLRGPGVSDMKGGILVMLEALSAFENSSLSSQLGWTVLLNPDEEIGSPGSASIITQQAAHHDLGMIYEPALPNGQLAGERKGSGNFTVIVKGVAAHAGREHHLGRNAICALAEFITELDRLNGQREGVTLNVGIVNGGVTTNQVPDRARCRFNIRTRISDDELWCKQQLQRIQQQINLKNGISLNLHGGFGRPPKSLNKAHLSLFQLVTDCSKQLGTPLVWEATGGCCDGNNLTAAGLPNVDTLGVLGGKIHSSQEFINIESLVHRAQLSTLILLQLAKQPNRWIRHRKPTPQELSNET